MDWLTRLPVIGPAVSWFLRTRVWRVYEHLDARKWSRHAAAVTFTSFLALFPMLAVGVAIGAAFLSPDRMAKVEDWFADQVPGISDRLDLQSLVDNAGTVGLVGGALLLVTGVRWAGTLRETLRAMWDLEEDPGNPVLLKLKDLGVLLGLGVVGLLSVAGSAFALAAVGWVADRAGPAEGGPGGLLLRLAGYAAAVATDFLLLWYVLKWLPRVEPPRRSLVAAGLMGAVGFELLKLVLGGYLQGVAAKSVYGAFGVPIALLLWISLMARLLLFCAGWTATSRSARPVRGMEAGDPEAGDAAEAAGEGADAGAAGVSPGPHGATAGTGPAAPSATGDAPRTPPPPAGQDSRR